MPWALPRNNRSLVLAGAGAFVAVLVAVYFLSPFFAARSLASAVRSHDADAISVRVDFPAVRSSLKDQFTAAFAKHMAEDKDLQDNPFAGLAVIVVSFVVDKAVDSIVTPDGLAAALERPIEPERATATGTKERWDWSWSFVDLGHFKSVYSKSDDPSIKFGLLFERRGTFTWKLVRLDLPLDEIVKRGQQVEQHEQRSENQEPQAPVSGTEQQSQSAENGSNTSGAECYDVSKGEPKVLIGVLDYVVFPGPPNFEDVQKGDTPEPSFVLQLQNPICIKGDDFADPTHRFRSVQIVETPAVAGRLMKYLHQQVSLTLKDQMAAETGHHHEPLVAWVVTVTPAVQPMDFIDEYGTAATTIRAFYAALKDGQGGVASQMIVPEKRGSGPFSPSVLSDFYGHLRQPIELIDISANEENEFLAHYRYAASSRVCDGRAVVRTVVRDGRNYIQSIRALDGC